MKRIAILLTVSVLVACKKEEITYFDQEQQPTASYSFASTPGSYMVYRLHEIDSLGNDIVVGSIDTVFVYGDTVINGNTYTKMSNLYPSSYPQYIRDSSGYIVGSGGNIVYAYVNLGEIFTETNMVYPSPSGQQITAILSAYMNSTTVNLQTEAAYFSDVYQYHMRLKDSAGGPVNICGDTEVYFDKYFVNGIGLVRSEYEFFGPAIDECSKKYWDLIDYYIAP